MNRVEFQQLAEQRLLDAEVLLATGRWQGAYYLLGYCIECALKACIAKRFQLHEVPEKKFVNDFYTHDFGKLLSISGVKPTLVGRAKADKAFDNNWNRVSFWNEAVRYDLGITETLARQMHAAVTDLTSGILPWLKTQW